MSSEPDCKDFPYAGWIPSVNGRLSFRHIGEARHPSEAIYTNVTTSNNRYIIAVQQRRLSDQLFQFITHILYQTEDCFYFVLSAETTDPPDRTDEIKGTVHIYKSADDWIVKGDKLVSDTIKSLNDARLAIDHERDKRILKGYARSQQRLQQTSDIEVDFVLWRTGEIFFSAPKFMEESLAVASIEYAESQRQDFSKWIADQAYFFIRDISHRHQHHSPDSDTILILQKHEDDRKWRANVLFSLHHYIIRSKRFADTKSLYRCAGVLAYANSFRATCCRFFNDYTVMPPFNEDELLQSLNARIGEQVNHTTEQGVIATIRLGRRVVALTFLAIIIAIVIMFVQPEIEGDRAPELRAASEFVADHWRPAVGTLIFLFAIQWAYSTDWFIRRQLLRDILEASNVWRSGAISLALILAVVVLILSVWFGREAAADLSKMIRDFWGLL